MVHIGARAGALVIVCSHVLAKTTDIGTSAPPHRMTEGHTTKVQAEASAAYPAKIAMSGPTLAVGRADENGRALPSLT